MKVQSSIQALQYLCVTLGLATKQQSINDTLLLKNLY